MKLMCLLAGIVTVVFCIGCRDQQRTYDQEARNRLFQRYLNGSLEEARISLNEELKFIESDSALPESGKAGQLFITYTRLYWLEKRSRNSDAARELLEKARHWNVARFELEGSPREEAASMAKDFDPESMAEQVDRLDRSSNNGKPPKFYSSINDKSAK